MIYARTAKIGSERVYFKIKRVYSLLVLSRTNAFTVGLIFR